MDMRDFYILGWYDQNGRSYLSTWEGPPVSYAVLTGVSPLKIAVWGRLLPQTAKLHEIPADKDKFEFAKELGGHVVLGWRKNGNKLD